jgi:hypothetical protein
MEKRNSILTLIVLLLGINISFAQDVNDPKHENHFKKIENIENEYFKIEINDAHAQQAFCQMKLKVTNKTKDYILIYPEEMVFNLKQGSFSPEPKRGGSAIIIAPHKNKSFTAKVAKETNYHVEQFTIEIKGFYLVSTYIEGLPTEKFQLPANKNHFETGNFKVSLSDSKQVTKETVAKFACTYQGDKIGIIDASRLMVTTEKGDYANAYRKSKVLLMQKGDKEKFVAKFEIEGRVLDMQFATMHIDWKDTFKEADKEPLESYKINFELDPELTAAKNK